MRIDSSAITMSSRTNTLEKHTKDESLKVWVGDKRPDFEGGSLSFAQLSSDLTDILDLSGKGKELQASRSNGLSEVEDDSTILEISDRDKQKLLMLQKMIEALTGKKIRFYSLDKVKLKKLPKASAGQIRQENMQPARKQGWGLEYDYNEFNYESQKMSFQSEGIIKTTDGREINFLIQLNMSREFVSQQNISMRAGDAVAKDPLVINFNGAAPQLTDRKLSFDLDCDGSEEQISFLSPDSGFLALDLNSDGKINSGAELFGPVSGNGFNDLSKYDSDGNMWIDENDSIFDKLCIWTKDAEGNDKLFALGQKGIGAIYLGNVNTSFDMKNSANQLQGTIQKTGVFVRENGTAGTIQHIDLAI